MPALTSGTGSAGAAPPLSADAAEGGQREAASADEEASWAGRADRPLAL